MYRAKGCRCPKKLLYNGSKRFLVTRSGLSYLTITALMLLLPTILTAQGYYPPKVQPHFSKDQGPKNSLLEAGFGYSFGFNKILLRDGDNANFAPIKKEIGLDSLAFAVQGETFVTSDLSVRIQGWINVPEKIRSDFVLYPPSPATNLATATTAWDTSARYIEGDLSASYFFGLHGMPYAAGLTVGYRYNDLNYESVQVSAPSGTFYDHFQVHIPYLGVYYAHTGLIGSVVRLDLLISPITLARLDSNRLQVPLPVQIDGHAVTGFWFESFFDWSVPVSNGAFLGAFAKYNYLELNGGATMMNAVQSTRFSMDSRKHLFITGINLSYRF
jgi:hypothetical protein